MIIRLSYDAEVNSANPCYASAMHSAFRFFLHLSFPPRWVRALFKFRRVVYHEPSRLVNGEKIKKPPPLLSEQGRLGLVADQSAASASSGTDADMEESVRLRSSLNASVVNFTTPSAVFAVS